MKKDIKNTIIDLLIIVLVPLTICGAITVLYITKLYLVVTLLVIIFMIVWYIIKNRNTDNTLIYNPIYSIDMKYSNNATEIGDKDISIHGDFICYTKGKLKNDICVLSKYEDKKYWTLYRNDEQIYCNSIKEKTEEIWDTFYKDKHLYELYLYKDNKTVTSILTIRNKFTGMKLLVALLENETLYIDEYDDNGDLKRSQDIDNIEDSKISVTVNSVDSKISYIYQTPSGYIRTFNGIEIDIRNYKELYYNFYSIKRKVVNKND